MKLVKVDSIPCFRGRRNKIVSLLDEFMASDMDAAEVTEWENEYKSIKYACVSIRASVKRCGYKILVRQKGEQIYVIKEINSLDKQEDK
jgi:hypothetical protein